MDAALRTILRELAADAPEIADWLNRLWHGAYTRAEQKTIARTIIEWARNHPLRDKILRALAMILRALGIPMPSMAAGGTVVSGGAAAGGAEAGGAAAGMTIGAALFMLVSIGVMSYRIYDELTQEIDSGTVFGRACSGGRLSRLMATGLREHTVSNWRGRKDSMQEAIDTAWTDAIRLRANCDGKCPPGFKCLPSVAVGEIEQWAYFPYNTTYTRITFTLPCFCLKVNDWWNQFRHEMLPEADQDLWRRLGWTEDNWDGDGETPESWSKKWDALDPEEREAAKALGYDEVSWNDS